MNARTMFSALLLAVLGASGTHGQSVSVATWRNNAAGAYSINHDDYGYNWWGDFWLMDSLLVNRELTVSFSVIAGQLDRGDSGRADLYVRHGYRFINHSMNHVCDTPVTNEHYEYDSAQARIERMIPSQGPCLYFVTPCGNQSASNLAWLRSHRYIGCRKEGGVVVIPASVPDPFDLAEPCYQIGTGLSGLNGHAQAAIDAGGWTIRQAHCVSDNAGLGWAPIPTAVYRSHLDWCRQQMDAGALWMAPVQTVLMYALERTRWSVSCSGSDANATTIAFNTGTVINPNVDNAVFTVPLTLLFDLPTGYDTGELQVAQSGVPLPFADIGGGRIMFDANPQGGPVTVSSGPLHAYRAALRLVRTPSAPHAPRIQVIGSSARGAVGEGGARFSLAGGLLGPHHTPSPGVYAVR